jgi:hypothetical protein
MVHEIGICCISVKHAVLMSKNKDAWNQTMCLPTDFFSVTIIKTEIVLVQSGYHHHMFSTACLTEMQQIPISCTIIPQGNLNSVTYFDNVLNVGSGF